MELLHGSLIPQFKVRQPILVFSKRIKQQDSLLVVGIFRENFPISYTRCRTLETHWDNTQSIRHPAVSSNDDSKLPDLIFNRLQLSNEEYLGMQRHTFGHYIAREAVLNEEYWMAAWLRAEAHWEALSYKRHAQIFKMKYADQEFKALKKRCSGQDGNLLQCFCLVAVKKEVKNVKRTVLNSIVGTMDLSVRQYLQGETYPGEVKRQSGVLANKQPFDAHKYAYISNVVVAKYARRRGIASNMLCLATDIATSVGMKKLYVHVTANNKPAQELYKKGGFKRSQVFIGLVLGSVSRIFAGSPQGKGLNVNNVSALLGGVKHPHQPLFGRLVLFWFGLSSIKWMGCWNLLKFPNWWFNISIIIAITTPYLLVGFL